MPQWYPPFCNRDSQWLSNPTGHKHRMHRRGWKSQRHGIVIGWDLSWRRPRHLRQAYQSQIPGRERDASWMSPHQVRMSKRSCNTAQE
jgi:hypothetical protein